MTRTEFLLTKALAYLSIVSATALLMSARPH
jgi:hypothetical protein